MNTQLTWVIVIIIAAVAVAIAAFVVSRRRRTERLRHRFGPEYERAVRHTGDVAKAEATLQARETRVERLHIRPLTAADAGRFTQAWRQVQTLFVDDPREAITDADRLVAEVMNARGYPVGDFEQRVADISVDHPAVVMNYRAARDIAQDHARGRASTEDLRQALVHYRALFDDLLETNAAEQSGSREPVAERDRS